MMASEATEGMGMNQPRRIGAQAERVESSHNSEANEIIGMLREAAMRIKQLGDEYERVKAEVASLQHQNANFEEQFASMSVHEEEFEEWQELLLNFKSGIIDQGELITGTVGR